MDLGHFFGFNKNLHPCIYFFGKKSNIKRIDLG